MKTNSKKIYTKRNELIKQELILKKKLLKLKVQEKKLCNLCSHDIVILFYDHIPRKIGRMFDCICPICSKKEEISVFNRLEDTDFYNAKIIDLTDYDIDIIDTYKKIQNELLEKYNYYYNSAISENNIKNSLINNVDIENFSKVKKK